MGGLKLRFLGVILGLCLLSPGLAQGAFPGENGKIAFSRGGDIYTMNPDGTGTQQLTTSGSDSEAAWSPNGRQIAFTSERDGNPEIYVMDANGAGQVRLTDTSAEESHPAWSPDGDKIVFDRLTRGVGYDNYVMNADGSAETPVTEGVDPVWSPDGQRIAFVYVNNITLVNPDGAGRLELTHYPVPTRDSHINSYDPNWSPDGRWIAFERIGGNGPQFFFELRVVRSDGTDQRTAYLNVANGEGTWSPDGRQMVVHGYLGLDLLDVHDTDFTTLPPFTGIPNTSFFDSQPDWQPLVPEPQRSDYKNGAKFCAALKGFLGDTGFAARYRNHGACVSRSH